MAIKGIDPAIFEQPDMRRALAERDITKVYQADSACMLAHLGHRDKCRTSLVRALDRWRPPDADDAAEMDWLNALIDAA